MRKLKALACGTLLAFAISQSCQAYVLEGWIWRQQFVWFWLQLTPTQYRLQWRTPPFPMWDGAWSFEQSFRDAMFDWSWFTQNIQLAAVDFGSTYGSSGDGINHVWFDTTSGGDTLDGQTLAVTQIYTLVANPSLFSETDITFNANQWWDSYRGPLSIYDVIDFHRVALHELGHAIGLDHPDDRGQNVSAIMNSRISDVDFLTSDDINGAHALYGIRHH